ncbi:hypothetical protein ACP70R_008205 [Stipagrostis hirtigluma subsp. patula]
MTPCTVDNDSDHARRVQQAEVEELANVYNDHKTISAIHDKLAKLEDSPPPRSTGAYAPHLYTPNGHDLAPSPSTVPRNNMSLFPTYDGRDDPIIAVAATLIIPMISEEPISDKEMAEYFTNTPFTGVSSSSISLYYMVPGGSC